MTDGQGDDVTVSGNPTPAPEGGEPTGGVGADFGGAPDDQEMPLADHIEEMVNRSLRVLLVMALVSAVVFPLADRLISFLWFSFLPGSAASCPVDAVAVAADAAPSGATDACPRLYHPLALLLARLKVASLVGLIVALPVFVYQTYLFMRPGLYPNERRYYLASVPTSLVLAGIGLLFAFLLILPLIFTYFLGYTEGAAETYFGLTQTFDLILLMLGMFAIIFQIPLFVMLAIMMGVTSRRWLEARRLYFWAGFAGFAFLFSPDPTGMAPFLVAATMVALFEVTLGLLRWSGEGSMAPGPDEIAGLRPMVWLLAAAGGYLASPAPLPDGYYDQLPGLFTGTIEGIGMAGMTPIVIGLVLLGAFEGTAYLLRRTGAPRQLRLLLAYLRVPVWLVVAVVGYMGHPNPALLDVADVALVPAQTAAAIAGLVVVAYEGWILVWRWRLRRRRP